MDDHYVRLACKRFQQYTLTNMNLYTLVAALSTQQRNAIRYDFDYTKDNVALANALNSIIDSTAVISDTQRTYILARARKALRRTLADGTNNLNDMLDKNTNLSFEEGYDLQFSVDRVNAIMETVAHQVVEDTSFAAAKNDGNNTKTWVTANDDRVRDAHAAIDGQAVPIGERFTLGNGESANFPGDILLSASQRINCRCTTRYQ